MSFKKSVLENGIRVITETKESSNIISLGLWVEVGTRDEEKKGFGLAHFVEHMVFKGTKKRTAFDLAKVMEEVGGDINASTSKETTCYSVTCLKNHLALAMDVISDLVKNPLFLEEDFIKEKQVIIQEIKMSEDMYEEYIFDLFFKECFGDSFVCNPILGEEANINSLSCSELVSFYKKWYQPQNFVLSISGAVDHDQTLDLTKKYLGDLTKTNQKIQRKIPKFSPFKKIEKRGSEQVHLLIGWPTASFTDEFRFESYIVNCLIGGGMTSRLYQNIREVRGLAYSVYSYLNSFVDAGLQMVYVGTTKKNLVEVYNQIMIELKKIVQEGLTEKELASYKEQVKGQILIGAEDVENRMNSLGVNELVFQKYSSVAFIEDKINKVSMESLQKYLKMHCDYENHGIYLLGDIEESELGAWWR